MIPNDDLLELQSLGLELTHAGPTGVLGPNRCKRFAAYVVNGTIEALEVSAQEGDPAGDDHPENSCIDNMLAVIEATNSRGVKRTADGEAK